MSQRGPRGRWGRPYLGAPTCGAESCELTRNKLKDRDDPSGLSGLLAVIGVFRKDAVSKIPQSLTLGLVLHKFGAERAVGAIIRYGLTFHISGVSRPVIGLILIIAGIVGLVLSLFYTASARGRVGGGTCDEPRV